MPSPVHKTVLAAAGGVAAAIGSALCCAGPLVAVFLGLSGAGLAATFAPLRVLFVVAALAGLGFGFYLLRREEQKACELGKPCASPVVRHRMKLVLWIATALAVPLLTFLWWSGFGLS